MSRNHIPVKIVPIELIVHLINEYADATRATAGETDDPYITPDWTLAATAERSDLIEVANELHPIFAAPDRAVTLLNDLADSTGLHHRVDPAGSLIWIRPSGAGAVRAATTASIIDFVTIQGIKSLGTCNADRCVDVYADRSQGRARMYCSDGCNNRSRAARWRARHTNPLPG